jgi:NitT/TauT family transport system substrate-binding protein
MIARRTLLGAGASFAALAALRGPALAADPVVRIATLPLDASGSCFYADEQGFFKAAHLDAQIQTIANGGAIIAAVTSGAVEIGFTNLVSAATAYKRGVPLTIVAPGSLDLDDAPTSALVVPASSAIQTARDFDGKTVAVNGIKNITQIAAMQWIDKNGGDSSKVKFVEMPFPPMIEALAAGRIDGAVVVEPFVAEAKRSSRLVADAFAAIGPRLLIGCWIASASWAKANPATIKAFASAMSRAAEWANGNRGASAVILERVGKLTPQTVAQMGRVRYATVARVAEMQPVIDVSAKYGLIPSAFPAQELLFIP